MDTRPTTIAILGGGQLGRMLGLAGVPLGLTCRFLDPGEHPPADIVGACTVGALDDQAALAAVLDGADVATYEWEGVPAIAGAWVAARVPLRPGVDALATSQDRLVEKQRFASLAIPTAPFVAVDTLADLEAGLTKLGAPAILKTRTGGYDGKGQVRIDAPTDAHAAWAAIGARPAILEGVVDFARELSVIAARGVDGTTAVFPVVENVHEHGILRTTLAPAPDLDAGRARDAAAFVERLLDDLDYVGVLTVELFETDDGLVANEFAPRVHNSGHWTIEGATTSQFEQHLRAITGLPLGAPDARGVSAMVNCIGALPDPAAVLAIPGAHLHTYGKAPRTGRKVGHVTITAPDAATRAARLDAVRAVLPADG